MVNDGRRVINQLVAKPSRSQAHMDFEVHLRARPEQALGKFGQFPAKGHIHALQNVRFARGTVADMMVADQLPVPGDEAHAAPRLCRDARLDISPPTPPTRGSA